MKRRLIALCSAFLLISACGCARHYLITLTNGGQITTNSKPRLKNVSYLFKDTKGKQQAVPAGRVTLIEPASMAKNEKDPFKPETR